MTPRVLLVEDHALVRSGIRSLLGNSGEVQVVGETGDGREVPELCEKLQVDIVLMDVEMRGLNGIEATRQLRASNKAVKVIMLSMYGDTKYVFESVRAGATGYVMKDVAFAELLAAIRAVHAGKRYFSAPLADLVMEDYVRRANGEMPADDLDRLSAREREVLQLVAEGNSSSQVAALLHLSTRTVDAHRFNVMQKLDIHSIAGLTKFAISNGLTSIR